MKPVVTFIIFAISMGISVEARSQQSSLKNQDPEAYFDFWIGEWEISYEEPDGTIATGRNIISRVLDGKVIQENFEVLTGRNKGYKGKSWSVYRTTTKEWKQTWVDNNGAYLEFKGVTEGGKRIFQGEAIGREGRKIHQRMVFKDITEDSLTWDWEASLDEGKSWQLQWRIKYTRVK